LECKREHTSLTEPRLEVDLPAKLFHDGFADHEAKADALGVLSDSAVEGAEEFEYFVVVFLLDPATSIGDVYFQEPLAFLEVRESLDSDGTFDCELERI